jgi:hypothetical protein
MGGKKPQVLRSFGGLDSSVCIATGYGWTVRESNPGGARYFAQV